MQVNKCDKCDKQFKKKIQLDTHIKLEECIDKLYIDKKKYAKYDDMPSFISEYVSFKKMIVGINHQYKPPTISIKEEKNDGQENNKNDEEQILICKFCDNTFTRNDSLTRHINKFCKVKKEVEKLKEYNPHLVDDKDIKISDYDMEEFKDKIEEIMNKYIESQQL